METNVAENTDGSNAHLPWGIVCDIVSRFPIEAIVRFTCLSKACYSLKKDAGFIKLQLTRANRRIILEPMSEESSEDKSLSTLYIIDEGEGRSSWKGREIPLQIKDEDYLCASGSCNGLLCVHSKSLYSKEFPLFIYNPISRESVSLPLSDPKPGFITAGVGFGFDSETGKYKVVKLLKIKRKPNDDNNMPFYMEGEIITVGESSWRQLLDIPYIVDVTATPVFSGKVFHWIIDPRVHPSGQERILVLDICTEKFRTIDFSITIRYPDNLRLVNFGNFLALIEQSDWVRFRVCKILGNNKDGYHIHKNSYQIPIQNLILRVFWSNDNFLIQCTPLSQSKEKWSNEQLALYCPKKKEFCIIAISGIPSLFILNFFVPSFVSPNALISDGSVEGILE
ncbi:hypothetical protein GIB67_005116 [Kingdonia uniflora]|uniref:F-box associated beta-propeller type 3 domain-containing protein n=1 Tax=Kingdonia uniflora TaxID=39325 RepID=A0A7J7PDV3_9MAGN|nr:hypothetical protein GIB67_005116 [Kingdonia uniflora]